MSASITRRALLEGFGAAALASSSRPSYPGPSLDVGPSFSSGARADGRAEDPVERAHSTPFSDVDVRLQNGRLDVTESVVVAMAGTFWFVERVAAAWPLRR